MTIRHYDKNGKPMEMMAWALALESDRRVGLDVLEDGTRVSTVWLGLDHSFGDGPPLIFETMVNLPKHGWTDQVRYSTLEQAEDGHKAMVEKWKGLICNGESREGLIGEDISE